MKSFFNFGQRILVVRKGIQGIHYSDEFIVGESTVMDIRIKRFSNILDMIRHLRESKEQMPVRLSMERTRSHKPHSPDLNCVVLCVSKETHSSNDYFEGRIMMQNGREYFVKCSRSFWDLTLIPPVVESTVNQTRESGVKLEEREAKVIFMPVTTDYFHATRTALAVGGY